MQAEHPQGSKPKKNLGGKIRGGCRRVFFTLLFVLLAAAAAGYFIANMSYRKGEKSGYLISVSQRGYLFKTYEGVLRTQTFESLDTPNVTRAENWSFSVKGDSLYQQLLQYQGKGVRLQYAEQIKALPWQGESDYFVEGFKPIPPRLERIQGLVHPDEKV